MKNILIPIEHLHIPPGQALNGKCPESCTRDMIKVAATSTDVRKRKILDLVNLMQYREIPTITEFGITIGGSFTQIDSHVLSDRRIIYKDNRTTAVKNGAWRGEEMSYLFPAPKTLKWGILNASRAGMTAVQNFVRDACQMARGHGLDLGEPKDVQVETLQRADRRNLSPIIEGFKKNGTRILFVIISGLGESYHDVKKEAELKWGILTQCIKQFTLERKMQDGGSTLNNILLKVNTKLGGTNHRVDNDPEVKTSSLTGPYMVIGADGNSSPLIFLKDRL